MTFQTAYLFLRLMQRVTAYGLILSLVYYAGKAMIYGLPPQPCGNDDLILLLFLGWL